MGDGHTDIEDPEVSEADQPGDQNHKDKTEDFIQKLKEKRKNSAFCDSRQLFLLQVVKGLNYLFVFFLFFVAV